MFTGIIEEVGALRSVTAGQGGGKRLSIQSGFEPATIKLGDSIATNGVCLTVTSHEGGLFTVDAGPETLQRTTIGALRPGDRVNLERAATLSTRLGGHLVQGHVDGLGEVLEIHKRENAYDLWIKTDPELLELAVPRGSIAVDGISLTITQREARGFSISIIPHTWAVTTMAKLARGSKVNLEADLIARYVSGILEAREGRKGITEAFLKKHGY